MDIILLSSLLNSIKSSRRNWNSFSTWSYL